MKRITVAAVCVRGKVRESGDEKIPSLFKKDLYMRDIYSTEESMSALSPAVTG